MARTITEKDKICAAMVAEGKSNEEIATAMECEVRTVEGRVLHLREKLKARNRAHLIAIMKDKKMI